jgi:hypothetical protein
MPPKLERLAADRVRDFKIPYFLFDLDKAQVFKRSEGSDDSRADKKAERYFFLQRHGLQYHR